MIQKSVGEINWTRTFFTWLHWTHNFEVIISLSIINFLFLLSLPAPYSVLTESGLGNVWVGGVWGFAGASLVDSHHTKLVSVALLQAWHSALCLGALWGGEGSWGAQVMYDYFYFYLRLWGTTASIYFGFNTWIILSTFLALKDTDPILGTEGLVALS